MSNYIDLFLSGHLLDLNSITRNMLECDPQFFTNKICIRRADINSPTILIHKIKRRKNAATKGDDRMFFQPLPFFRSQVDIRDFRRIYSMRYLLESIQFLLD